MFINVNFVCDYIIYLTLLWCFPQYMSMFKTISMIIKSDVITMGPQFTIIFRAYNPLRSRTSTICRL